MLNRLVGAIHEFDNIANWSLQTGAGTTQTYITDPLYSLDGSSILMTGADTVAFMRNFAEPKSMEGYEGVSLRFYIPNKASFKRISLYLSNDTTFTNYATYVIYDYMVYEGYNEINVSFEQFNYYGTFNSQEIMQTIQVRIEPNIGQTVEVYFDSLEAVKAERGNVIFTMDDQWDTQYSEAFRILDQYGFNGNIAVIPSKVDTTNYMTLSQLKEVYRKGWDLVNHTYNHPNLSTLLKEDQRTELLDTKNWLNGNGFDRASNYVIYPYGGYNSETFQVLEEEGFLYGRSLITGLETNPTRSRFETKAFNLTQDITVEKAIQMVDAAIATGSTLQFINHRFAETVDPMFYSPDKYREIVDYVYQNRKKLNVITVSEWMKNFNTV